MKKRLLVLEKVNLGIRVDLFKVELGNFLVADGTSMNAVVRVINAVPLSKTFAVCRVFVWHWSGFREWSKEEPWPLLQKSRIWFDVRLTIRHDDEKPRHQKIRTDFQCSSVTTATVWNCICSQLCICYCNKCSECRQNNFHFWIKLQDKSLKRKSYIFQRKRFIHQRGIFTHSVAGEFPRNVTTLRRKIIAK